MFKSKNTMKMFWGCEKKCAGKSICQHCGRSDGPNSRDMSRGLQGNGVDNVVILTPRTSVSGGTADAQTRGYMSYADGERGIKRVFEPDA